ncbi:Ig-like domain-containing protein [Cryobacterium zhongshanensis]|uniref:Ig-like domain-containing protein n=1 Tax=Cryobacterium zhongshanensis TaxID=2928153 RepID=A0AA41QVQ6_9MICO|nr:Ig-like domain-containing protein [Cryobacterium zhongshanensis]MCI4658200.1 Ig-like domain-containing protein [Cryobacterium zhongshanensis]
MAGRRLTGRRNPARTPWPGWVRIVAVAASATLLVGAAVVANGFDVKQTPVSDSSVWALQNGTGNRYARVNTDLGELDTVKTVRSPSTLVQTASNVLLFAQNNEKVVDVSLADPLDLSDTSPEYQNTPSGTVSVVSSGDWVGYLTSNGDVYTAHGGADAASAPTRFDPYAGDAVVAGESRPVYRSDAIAIGSDGVLSSYSGATTSVVRFSIGTGKVDGTDPITDGPTEAGSQLTVVGSTWALLNAAGDRLWLRGRDQPVTTDASARAMLQRPSPAGDIVYLADEAGLAGFALSDGARSSADLGGSGTLGIPAAPTAFDGSVYAAWLPSTGTAGTLWSSTAGARPLSYGAATANGDPAPVFQATGSRMILNDTQSGWVWTIPDGSLVPSSQDWGLASQNEPKQSSDVEKASVVVDPKAPVAEPDSFGVRAGSLVQLPVLLNDHDANEDVLTIAPALVTGLNPDFGTLSITDQGQSLAVQVAPGAQGAATFSYGVTDGTRVDGLDSPPTTVTLTVHEASVNAAPVWCGTTGCLRDWPAPEVQPGGMVSVSVLPGWVDPDGDPLFVSEATDTTGIGSVSATPDGTLVFKHPNPADSSLQPVSIDVRVSDVYGATATKALQIQVTPAPKLSVRPFALLAAVGERITVDPAAHIDGSAGAVQITSVTTPPSTEGVTQAVNTGGGSFDFSADRPGSYLVSMTVADALSTVISLVRITVVAPDTTPLTTSPVSVFVRPKIDTSVDVFTAVSNPAGRILLLSDALPERAAGATLDVDVVGQTILRVRGTSATEQPGQIGVVRYTVSDGTGNPAATVRGQATVYLLPPSIPQAPIAVADRVVVRAGAQIDIPVLNNDVAPDGNVVMLNAESIDNPSGKGLAFAAGSVLRYLAPEEAGSYELRYGIYIAGSAELVDSASVTVEVLADGRNRAPLPRVLTGRVLSGESVEIPFDSFGVDPDGDSVLLDRVMTQPPSGTAAVTAAGNAIVYRSVAGFNGPVQFTYRVRDAAGETATALVRIGVLDQRANPRPITFSDYVEVEAGATNQVVVSPTGNDIEPAGAALTLGAVTPDAPADTAEFAALSERIGAVTGNTVVLTAGLQQGTMTFVYSVTNPNGDIGLGLIVMKVVRASVPDYPVVTDTLIATEQRSKLPAGIDVVTGKVSWASGDVGGLTLALWGDAHGLTVSGWTITGTAPDSGFLVPFSLTGTNFNGVVVTTYGFLRLPAKDAVILALNRGDATQKVKEGASVSFDLAKLVTIPEGTTLEIDGGNVAASGQRTAATCRVEGGTTLTYTAGAGAPWTDTCSIPARISGQAEFTELVVPVKVEPLDPQPVLRSASLTQSPGSAAITFDLTQMATWTGHTDLSPLAFTVGSAGSLFTVAKTGSTLSITTADTAPPGSEVAVAVSLSSNPQTPAAVLSLKVGPAPSALPKGGTTSSECSQSKGSSCSIDVIGTAGEVNLYASTALTLVSVGSATCAGVSFSVADARHVTAAWAADAAGGSCQTSFVVRDAQGRDSAGERNGSVTVDLHGFPKAPNSVTQADYKDRSITLVVSPGAAAVAYPPLTGFTITQNGQTVGSCDASGRCGPIATAANGARLGYEARSVNAEGTSTGSVSVTAWSYANPGLGDVTAATVYDRGITSDTAGAVNVTIGNSDESTNRYDVNGHQYPRGAGATTALTLTLPVGDQSVVVTPLSAYTPPLTNGPATAAISTPVSVAGKPLVTSVGTVTATKTTLTVSGYAVDPNSSTKPLKYLFLPYDHGQPPACPAAAGDLGYEGSATMTGLTENATYDVELCASNGFGVVSAIVTADSGPVLTWSEPKAPGDGTYTYAVTTAKGGGKYTITSEPTSAVAPPAKFVPVFSRIPDTWGADPVITVKYCLETRADRCGPESAVTAFAPTRAWQASIEDLTVASCTANGALTLTVAGPGTATAVGTATVFWFYTPPAPDPVPATGPSAALTTPKEGTWAKATGAQVPAGATKVRNVTGTVTWTGASTSGLDPFTLSTGTDARPGTETPCN